MTRTDVDVDGHVAEIAVRMSDRQAAIASAIASVVHHEIAAMRNDTLIDLRNAAIDANVATVLHAIRYGIAVESVEAPIAALEHARRLAQQGAPVNALVRAYRLGQRRMTELVFTELGAIDMTPQARISAIEAITQTLFSYIDRVSEHVVTAYQEERERWLESQNRMRDLRIREVLDAGKSVDVDGASTSIRYPLRWHHVALVLWYPAAGEANELARLQRSVRELATAAGAESAPLFTAVDGRSAWAWLPYRAAPSTAVHAVREFLQQQGDPPSVSIGSPAAGVDGFRASHSQAEAGRWVAEARGDRTPTVIAATDPGHAVATLLGGDTEHARTWVTDVLGGLSTNTENEARLRETLRVFLACGSSYKIAAEQLCVHTNTVKYRVARAIARRGHPITDDRLDVELALLLCHWYGAAVLKQQEV